MCLCSLAAFFYFTSFDYHVPFVVSFTFILLVVIKLLESIGLQFLPIFENFGNITSNYFSVLQSIPSLVGIFGIARMQYVSLLELNIY